MAARSNGRSRPDVLELLTARRRCWVDGCRQVDIRKRRRSFRGLGYGQEARWPYLDKLAASNRTQPGRARTSHRIGTAKVGLRRSRRFNDSACAQETPPECPLSGNALLPTAFLTSSPADRQAARASRGAIARENSLVEGEEGERAGLRIEAGSLPRTDRRVEPKGGEHACAMSSVMIGVEDLAAPSGSTRTASGARSSTTHQRSRCSNRS
jgi:hypothetical protein